MRAPDFGRERPRSNWWRSRDARSRSGRGRLAWRRAEIAESDIVETLDTDFLIIGAGTAGLAAAGAAADLGLNFIACDKSNQVPETREYLGGVDTAYAKANNVTIDRPKLLNELTRYASGKCNQKLIKRWIDDSAEYIDWVTEVMKDAGKEVMLDMPPEHATAVPTTMCPMCSTCGSPLTSRPRATTSSPSACPAKVTTFCSSIRW